MWWVPLAAAAIGAMKAPPAMAAPIGPMQGAGYFDNSGWTVATGKATATASRTEQVEGIGTGIERIMPWAMLALVGVVAVKAWSKKSK